MGLFDGLFGGGVSGGGGSSFYRWYKQYILDQQAATELSQERVDEQAKTQTEYRRNEIADRQGYAGLVNVGPATQETDATLAARMALLPQDSPERTTYETQLKDEAAKRAQATRIITGEQYDVEDKFAALSKDLGDSTSTDDLEKRLADLGTLSGQYDWYDAASIKTDLEKRLDKARKRAAQGVGAGTPDYSSGDGGGAASAGDGGGGAASS